MKLTITLSAQEIEGSKPYLKSDDEPTDKASIQRYIQNIVSGVIHNPNESVGDYVNQQA